MVPENIHTPTMEGIGNSGGVGGSKAQKIPERRGVVSEITFPDGQVRYVLPADILHRKNNILGN